MYRAGLWSHESMLAQEVSTNSFALDNNVYETTQFTYEPYPVYVRDEGAVVTNDALTPIMDCL